MANPESVLLTNALQNPNDYTIALLYKGITKSKIICFDIAHCNCYYFNNKTCLYTMVEVNEIAGMITEELYKYVTNKMTENRDMSLMKSYAKLFSKFGGLDFMKNVAKRLCTLTYETNFTKNLNSNKDEINFKNGIVNLKTGIFRPRTDQDLITKCLDYDYSEEQDEEMINKINLMMFNICNDDIETLEFNLDWFGYCLTGHTREQLFLCTVGHSASNGKSTMIKMIESAFPIYCIKLDKQTFNKDYTKRHKQFATIEKPVRIVYQEELDTKELDNEVLKDFIDGNKIGNNEVMFGTAKDIIIECKLNILSNYTPKFKADEGVKRRGRYQEFTNRFISKEDLDSAKNKKGLYLKNVKLDQLMEQNKFKLSMFHLLLPHCMQYYEKGLNVPKKMEDLFKDVCDDNDKMKSFIEKYYHETKSENDRVYKDDFLELYRGYCHNNNYQWSTVLNEVKRLGIKYNPKMRINSSGQGCIIGLKLKQEPLKDLFIVCDQQKKKQSPLDDTIDSETDEDSDSDSDESSDEDSDEDSEDERIESGIDKILKSMKK
jgi:phage/plasmid-associated DNA primase